MEPPGGLEHAPNRKFYWFAISIRPSLSSSTINWERSFIICVGVIFVAKSSAYTKWRGIGVLDDTGCGIRLYRLYRWNGCVEWFMWFGGYGRCFYRFEQRNYINRWLDLRTTYFGGWNIVTRRDMCEQLVSWLVNEVTAAVLVYGNRRLGHG